MWPNTDIAYLDIILGPMFSGKTSKLIEIYNYCLNHNIGIIAINHSLDTRYGKNVITSHDNKSIPCIQVKNLYDIFNNEEYCNKFSEAKVVLINEGQFFEDLFDFVLYILEQKFKQIHICGLDGDFKRCKFGQMLDLIPHCDNVTKYKAICKNCSLGELGLFTHRNSSEEGQISIGSENYESLCRYCYNKSKLDEEHLFNYLKKQFKLN